jgi:hypothetical protein
MASKNLQLQPSVELVLDITPNGEASVCGYYFVDRETRTVFWLEPFNARRFCSEIKAKLDEPQISAHNHHVQN